MKKISALVLAALLAAGGYLYYTPYGAVKNLAEAVKAKDLDTVAQYIDTAALRNNLAEQMKAVVGKKMLGEMSDNPFSALAMSLAAPMVEALSLGVGTPTGVTKILNGQNPLDILSDKAVEAVNAQTGGLNWENAETEYLDMNTFQVKWQNEQNQALRVVFERNGLTAWKMTKLMLPLAE
ncbi:MAG: DUF2939 domain-containing protein [Neisseria sp.]|nr:DUF2939 domain-containing protein [Neisseria sp.]